MSSEHNFLNLVLRLMLCLATAVFISATAYLCAWFNYRNYLYFRLDQYMTQGDLELLREGIVHHKEETGSLPATLADLEVVKKERVKVDEKGRPVDAWRRPFYYQIKGDSYDLYSLGRDGQPGGAGLDADLHAGKVDPRTQWLTLWQFMNHAETAGIRDTCILAGILAFPLCLLGVKRGATSRLSPIKVLVIHGVTAAFAILAAVVISVLHLPTGH